MRYCTQSENLFGRLGFTTGSLLYGQWDPENRTNGPSPAQISTGRGGCPANVVQGSADKALCLTSEG